MNEADIWRIAREMVRDYGSEALSHARHRAQQLQRHGIPNDAEEWNRVADAIAKLERKTPDDGEALN